MQNQVEEQGSDKQSYQTPNMMEVMPTLPSLITSTEVTETRLVVVAAHRWTEECEAFLNSAMDSVNSRRAYRRHLKNAGVSLGVDSVADVTGADLAAYRAEVMASDLATSSQGQAISALRSFLNWSGDLGGHQLSARALKTALRSPKGGTAVRYNTISEREIGAILNAARSPRERALLGVMLGSGLRVSEVSHLTVADVVEDMDGVSLYVRAGKGNRNRVVPIQRDLDDIIRSYLVSTGRRLGGEGQLFLAQDRGVVTRSSKGLSSRAISRIVHELADAAGISAKAVSPHALRHSFALRCLRAGGNVMAVAKLLGHSSIVTTQRYVDHLATSELRSTVPNLPVLDG